MPKTDTTPTPTQTPTKNWARAGRYWCVVRVRSGREPGERVVEYADPLTGQRREERERC